MSLAGNAWLEGPLATAHVPETQADLIAQIDHFRQQHLSSATIADLETLFIRSLHAFRHIHGLRYPPGLLLFSGEEFRWFGRPPAGAPTSFPISDVLAPLLKEQGAGQTIRIGSREATPIADAIGGQAELVVARLKTTTSVPLGIVVIGTSWVSGQSLASLREPLGAVVARLNAAYLSHREQATARWFSNLWDSFLDHGLSPTACFNAFAAALPALLPMFGCLKPTGAVQSQVLTLVKPTQARSLDEHLIIRGTTGHERPGTRLALDRSICGLMVTDTTRKVFCDDPTLPEYSGRYRNYLAGKNRARTELVIRLEDKDQIVGVINLESRAPKAFNIQHQQELLANQQKLAQLAAALERRVQMNAEMQGAVASSTQSYLGALAGIFRHGINTPHGTMTANAEHSLRLLIDVDHAVAVLDESRDKLGRRHDHALDALKTAAMRLKTQLRLLTVAHKEAAAFTTKFANEIDGYAKPTAMRLSEILRDEIEFARSCLLDSASSIRIEPLRSSGRAKADGVVNCSTLIKQHLYSIFHNSVDSIRERQESDPAAGVISVRMSAEVPPENQEVRLNSSWVVRIRDNGGGVPQAQLEELRRFNPGTSFKKKGTGSGLTAAQRYITSIGGRLELDSNLGEFFEVAIFFEEGRLNDPQSPPTLNPDRDEHGQAVAHSDGRGQGELSGDLDSDP